jgi:hypothetical protein
MSKCERSATPENACEHQASFSVVYTNGVRLALCEAHTEDVAEDVAEDVSPIRTERTAAIETQLSALAGAPVRVFRHSPAGGVVLAGAFPVLARMHGHRMVDTGTMYFTAEALEAMLDAAARTAA